MSRPAAPAPPTEPAQEELLSISLQFDRIAAAQPEALALSSPGGRVTFSELQSQAGGIALHLTRSVERQQVLAIFAQGDRARIAAMLGSMRAGTIFVVLNPAYPGEMISWILQHSGARMLLTDQPFAERAHRLSDLPVSLIEQIQPATENEIGIAYPEVTDLATIAYTSGSTGRPKGVGRPHSLMVRSARSKKTMMQPGDRAALLTSPGFAGGTSEIVVALLNGVSLHTFDLDQHSFHDLADWIDDEKITVLRAVTSLFRHFMLAIGPDRRFPTVHSVRIGAELVSPHDIDLFRRNFPDGTRLFLSYAATETGPIANWSLDASTAIEGAVPTGWPVPGVEVRIVDDQGRALPPGMSGEIVVISDRAPRGYWRDPELTRERFELQNDGRRSIRTGDSGYLREDGALIVSGRVDQQIKIRGNRVEPSAIENALMTHPEVHNAAVVGRRSEGGDASLVAFVVTGTPLPSAELRSWLRSRLPGWMIPARFVRLDAIPVHTNQKTDRLRLASMEIPDDPARRDPSAALDPVEESLCRIWEAVLQRSSVDPEDDFFDLGGDSLLAARVIAMIEKEFGRVPAGRLLKEPTVRGQAKILRGDTRSESDVLVPFRPTGSRPPLFLVGGGGGGVMGLHHIATSLGEDQPAWGLQSHGLHPHPSTLEETAALFIGAMRTVQPEGPYRILGYSLGGLLAFEMTRQLSAMHAEVALLALLDATAGSPRVSLVRRGITRLQLIARNPLYRIRQFSIEYIKRVRRWWTFRRAIRQRTRGREIPSTLRATALTRSEANRRYDPLPWNGRAVLLRAEWGTRTVVSEPDLGWSRLVLGGVEIRDIAGDHFNFTQPPLAAS
ncbi:MAG TPA: AMP-binding protein, partial [Thermoanaerobaculia bacterium]|nr:AMP-binding protein [Thermoanaerobaculia bacterium]